MGEFGKVRQTDLIRMLDTSRKIVLEWEDAGMPRNPDKSYDLFMVMPWLKARWIGEKRDSEATDSKSPSLERWRAAKADQEEIRLAVRRGELVEVVRVKGEWSRLMTELKNGLLGLPHRIALRLEGKPAKAIAASLDSALRDEIERVRVRYSSSAIEKDSKKPRKKPSKSQAKSKAKASSRRRSK